jgi:hypothetical protein
MGDWQKLYQQCQAEEVQSISDLVESMAALLAAFLRESLVLH